MAKVTQSTTYSDQQVLNRAFDDTNNTVATQEGYAPLYEDNVVGVAKVEQRFSPSNITTNATTVVKTGAGMLHTIIVNNPSALTVANLTITIYDNTAASGTKLGTITVPFGLTTALPFTLSFNSIFATGLTIVTAGPTVTADITVNYR